MKPSELAEFLAPSMSRAGLALDEIQDGITYAERRAWAIYYSSATCRLQICWSEREEGIDFMLARPCAPDEFGLLNPSKAWHYMLLLSAIDDDLPTPGLYADENEVMVWLRDLFEIHFEAARAALLSKA